MDFLITVGATSRRIPVWLADSSSTTGGGLTGLVFNSAGLTCYYWREDEGNVNATAVTLATMTRGTWATGGFIQKDATNMPGLYEFGIPDAALASGAKWVRVMFKGATNLAQRVIHIRLSAIDLDTALSSQTVGTVTTTTTATNVTTVNGLAANVITAASIAADAITAAKVADGAIDAATFAAGAINAAAIAADAITAAKIADGAIDAATFAAGAITATVIADGAIDAGALAAGTITSAKFAAGAIDAAAISTDAGNEIADALLDRNMATGADSGTEIIRTPRQALRAARNKAAIAAGTLTVYKEDDTAASWTAAITTAAGNPITTVDPT